MRLRNEAEYNKRRNRIIHIAHTEIMRSGVENISFRRIAKLAGYRAPSLYEYFTSRDELLFEITRTVMRSLYNALASVEEKDPGKHLIEITLSYVRFAVNEPENFNLLNSFLHSKRQSLHDTVKDDAPYNLLLQAVENFLSGNENPETDHTEKETLAFGIWSLAHGIACLRAGFLQNFDTDFEKTTRHILSDFILNYNRSNTQ